MKTRIKTLLAALASCAVISVPAAAEVIIASFDSRSETDGDPGPTNATTSDLAVGPVSAGRSFRTYLTFDLTSATAVNPGGSVELVLQHTSSAGTPNVGNTSALAQVFTLFEVASDWDGVASPGPEGTAIDTANVNVTTGNFGENLVFNGTGLLSAFNSAVGGTLYLGIKSDAENTDARSFVWYGSVEDGEGNQPAITTVVPEPGSLALLGLGGLLVARRRRG